MSWPRAGPVLNLVRSTWKNGSILIPSGPICASRTQKFSERSSVLRRELVIYILLPSPVTCIMFGCTPGLTLLVSRGFLRSLTSHCWISLPPKQLTYRKRSSGDCRRSAGSLPVSQNLRAVYLPSASPSQSQMDLSRAQLVKPWLAPSLSDQRHSSGAAPVLTLA